MDNAIFSGELNNSLVQNVDGLERDAKEYPFSSLSQYLLLSQYKKLRHPDYENQARKMALYFANHRWLQFQLSQLKDEQEISSPILKKSNPNTHGQQKEIHDHFAVVTEEELMSFTNDLEIEEQIPEVRTLGEHVERVEPTEAADQPFILGEGDLPDTETIGSHIHDLESYSNEYVQEFQEAIPETEALGSHLHDVESYDNGNVQEFQEAIPETEALGSHHVGEQETAKEIDLENPEVETNVNQSSDDEEIQSAASEEIQKSSAIEVQLNPEVSAIAESSGTQDSTDSAKEVEPVVFEPMHTVDYFASQGIKVPDESFANDKLGAQMKSFTEWLKSMKKIQPEKLQAENTLAEDIIKSAAEVSNIDTEVLTEAMAEVLIKQDKREKAISMYNKLSLINPSKSAYFAAKIESIKST